MSPLSAIVFLAAPILIAGAVAFAIKVNQARLRLILAFSAAYLFAISIMHMLPEAFVDAADVKITGLFIVLGFCLQLLMDTFSTGIEHGHVHLHSHTCHKHLPYGIIIGLMLHSYLEGLPIYEPRGLNGSVNYQLILGLCIHNLPITIAFVSLLKEHETKKLSAWLLLFAFSMMSPLGYMSSYLLQSFGLQNYEAFSQAAFAVVIGIFLHISTAILFETSDQHKYNIRKIIVMSLGIILAYMIS